MEKFIEEIKKRGIFARIVNSCLFGNTVSKCDEVSTETVELMLECEMKCDSSLTELFVDCVSDIGFQMVTDAVTQEVQKQKKEKSKEEIIQDSLNRIDKAFNRLFEALIDQEDDLK